MSSMVTGIKTWLCGSRRLARRGVLSMNRRNAACLHQLNPRALVAIVDDKLRTSELCARIGIPTPAFLGAVEVHGQIRHLEDILNGRPDFVIKPNRGSGGRGVLVVLARDRELFLRPNGQRLHISDLKRHVANILSGMHSLGGFPDRAFFQERVRLHRDLGSICYKGTPDIRVIVYRGEPAMAMLRLPTSDSNGRANLHQGGIGVGVDLDSGITQHAIRLGEAIDLHPDTNAMLIGRRVPHWDEVLAMARRVAAAVGLGFVGIDIVIDADRGPMLLEANARPGLAIQLANDQGLGQVLAEIDARMST